MSEDEEDIRPRSPLIQQLPPEEEEYPPVPARPLVAGLAAVPQQRTGPSLEGSPSVSQRWEESAPSTLVLGPSTMRIREESETEQVSAKRQKTSYEERLEESTPSTSGLGSSTHNSGEESYRDSAPLTSGLSSSTNRRHSMSPFILWVEDSDSD